MGGRAGTGPAPGGGGSGGIGGGAPLAQPRTLRERFGALRNLPPFLKLVWQTSPALTLATLLLRLTRAVLPVATLFVGKLIIDEVLARASSPFAVRNQRAARSTPSPRSVRAASSVATLMNE